MVRVSFQSILFSMFICFCFVLITESQETPKTKLGNQEVVEDDVLKIETNLIQTGVTVFDENGKQVSSLGKNDFELKVDGKPVAVTFFEPVFKDIKNYSKTENKSNPTQKSNSQLEPGRTFLFIVDDLHLAEVGTHLTKKLLNEFIENKLNKNDVVAIVSTTGKIGFLQQYSNDRVMLKAAVDRIIFNRNYKVNDSQQPPMSEYEAMLIDRFDPEVTNYFVDIVMRENPGTRRENVEAAVRSRASNIIFQSELYTKNTITVVEQAIRRSAQFPGRKIVFLLSDGFLLNQKSGDNTTRLRRVIDAASRTNSVIYSFDTKGLEAELPPVDNKTSRRSQRTQRVQSGEQFEGLDGMNYLANETGGRLYKDTNDLITPVDKSTIEASGYYLLAWEPEEEFVKTDKLRKIEVTVKGQPKLQVRLQSGYLNQPEIKPTNAEKNKKEPAKIKLSAEAQQLNAALNSQAIIKKLPTSLEINFLDYPNEGILLSTAIQIKGEHLNFQKGETENFTEVDFEGAIYDSEGKNQGYFNDRVKLEYQTPKSSNAIYLDMFHNKRMKLKPGLYQVRIASRELKSGNVGNANKWILIPDLSSKKLALSSLLLSEIKPGKNLIESNEKKNENTGISVDRTFSKSSYLNYTIFVYNATKTPSQNGIPEVIIQTQLLKNGELIMNGNPRTIPTEKQDFDRLFYSADIPLETLATGEYEIQVIITDKLTKNSISAREHFSVR